MNPPFSDREAGQMLEKLEGVSTQIVEVRRDLSRMGSQFEIAHAAERTERSHEMDKLRGELGRRIDELSDDVKELSGYRWKLVGFFLAGGVGWTGITTLLALYIANNH